ncbi:MULTISPECIES: 4'-phosphopantetheinyl transferase superfamily protein [Bradyrhizobium]|uniref:4'-phosphopantetheinyl transferase superfamily protein n=1 Tax=Bradyrhizobium TaxID=374 RepID=UPI0018AD5C54|nr:MULTISPECIES: 4'-phosphopantetheinyl transferase superfamily protein [Bradyrhizobium]MBR1001967.1 4'-phosphopantetheinyl transferase superfamily protein [Bradyrhizobium liaoningense]MCP1749195.1 4'-phosphopantetheinyl transferase [Bradyrhizobium japonicum]MCP1855153.1 4'-phosphopantetheinyl transferase [Bradyrhizobium japonicum]MCP1897806.1 4'-phosphopantetheinyl transferase [Bradyrhizobium japonicum]MCW2330969.1 4'-phosphopantetheinyl transferase [Bradyrhizobium japonicum]
MNRVEPSTGIKLPGPGRADVWVVDFAECVDPCGGTALLSDAELQRASQFHFAGDRTRYVHVHACLRLILARYLGRRPREISYRMNARGKPELGDGAGLLHFNLSHTDDLALVALADREIGIDIEALRPFEDAMDLAGRFFCEQEAAEVRRAAPAERAEIFLRLWTRKEAVLKALGLGIGDGLDQVRVPTGNLQGAKTALRGSEPVHLRDISLASPHLAAIASLAPIERIEWKRAPSPHNFPTMHRECDDREQFV